jgi:hypothetical protein
VPRVDTTFDAFGNPIDFVDLTGPVEYPEAEVEAALETARSHPTATGEAWAALGVQVKSD